MTDLLFKNLTSSDKKRKIIASSEVAESQGVLSIIRRHFIWTVKELKGNPVGSPPPYLYILKVRDTREQRERFFCKLKGSVYLAHKGKLFLVVFMHSLRIDLAATVKLDKV